MKEKTIAIVLAAGKGSRMHAEIQKQYMTLLGRPVLTYSLETFEKSNADEIILVVGAGEIPYVKKEVIDKYGYRKVTRIVEGGKERYESVYFGLCAAQSVSEDTYVLIHDGARAFLTAAQVNQCIEQVKKYKACTMGMPVKDTIKIVNKDNIAIAAPDRKTMWQMQTPQCFVLPEIREAYRQLLEAGDQNVTDDGMVMERYGSRKVKMIEGSYDNIKITTPEDLILGEAILLHKNKKEMQHNKKR